MKLKLLLPLAIGLLLLHMGASAQDGDIIKLGFDARADWVHESLNGDKVDPNSGFKGKYFNIRLDGHISSKFDFSYRQRLNRPNKSDSFFDATDWLWLRYQPTNNWAISAGKQVVLIGGWEYDRSPIDLYFCSEFWNNISCYQWGASVTYTSDKGNNSLTFQACQSPFDTPDNDLYAYNLMWNVKSGCYTGIHTLNASEFANGNYIYYVALGNRFNWGDAALEVDYMERISSGNSLFDNFSVMGEFSYLIAKRVNIFAKATYDKCSYGYTSGKDFTIYPGTEITRLGGGVEYYPLGGRGDRSVRIHAVYSYTIGNNTNPAGTALDEQSIFTIGATWKVDILKIAKKLFGRNGKSQQ